MLDILRDNIWNFVGVLIAIAAIVLSIVFYYRQKSKKSLSYDIWGEVVLPPINKEIGEKVKI